MLPTDPPFEPFPKIPRLTRECVITEKLDGTNAQVFISDDGLTMKVGSRNRWLSLDQDNYGFCAWAVEHQDELMKLGPGRHYGEWWGLGIQRGYGLTEKRFSLFDVHRWGPGRQELPACCGVVPLISDGMFSEMSTNDAIALLKERGSLAVPGYMNPEGIVIYHSASKQLFKKLIENDHLPKGTHGP